VKTKYTSAGFDCNGSEPCGENRAAARAYRNHRQQSVVATPSGSRQGTVVLAKYRDIRDPYAGAGYTVKLYSP
jgi:hypothetical protein